MTTNIVVMAVSASIVASFPISTIITTLTLQEEKQEIKLSSCIMELKNHFLPLLRLKQAIYSGLIQ